MSLPKSIFVVIGLLFLVMPLNLNAGQWTIHSSEGTQVVGTPDEPSDSSSSKDKGDNWGRIYAPGERERENQQAKQEAARQEREREQDAREASRANLEKKRLENKRNAIGSWSKGQEVLNKRERELKEDPDQYFYDKEQRDKEAAAHPHGVVHDQSGNVTGHY
jgi:hypothetical protein